MKTLVVGIGNVLLGDDGVGIHALHHLENCLPELNGQVECLDGGTLSFTLAVPIEDADNLIVIDAAELSSSPGTIKVFEGDAMDTFLGTGPKKSVHEVSLADVLSVAAMTDSLPQQRAFIGIQPKTVDWADEPTIEIQNAIPQASKMARTLLQRWHA